MKIPESCKLCEELVKTRSQIVYGYGNEKSKIMFVGICPGNHLRQGGADKSGIPFFGDRSGTIFGNMLNDIELNRDDVYTTNLVKCRPSDKSRMYNRPPTEQEISNCSQFIHKEIDIIRPRVIIALGKIVYKALVEPEGYRCAICYHWHPAFIAREPGFYPTWISGINKNIKKFTAPLLLQSSVEEFIK